MGAAQHQPQESSDSESSNSSSSSDEGEEQGKALATRRTAEKTAPAQRGQMQKKRSSEQSKQESIQSFSSLPSSEARSELEAGAFLLLGRPVLCCCGSGMESGSKELLQATVEPETPPRQPLPAAAKMKSTKPIKSVLDDAPNKRRVSARQDDDGDDDDGTASVGGRSARSDFSVSTAVVAQHGKSAPGDASQVKKDLKEFVKGMVGGRDLHLLQNKSGDLRPLGCAFTPEVDALLIADRVPQRILLKDIAFVHQGLEAIPLELEYKLDANMAVLELSSGNCVTFHMGHPKTAEDFVLHMRLLTAMQRQKARKENLKNPPTAGVAATDDDDAKSECSVKTDNMKQQIKTMKMSSVSTDPHEAKLMFRMFKETMKRGKEFYVVKGDGQMQDVECALSRGHDVFRMRWDFQTREIPMRDMLNVLTAEQAGSLRLDELCAAIELRSGECITFKFGHVEACERFVFCMRMLVDQKRERFVAPDLARGASSPDVGTEIVSSFDDSLRSSVDAKGRSGDKRRGSRSFGSASPKQGRSLDPQVEVETFVRQMVVGCILGVIGSAGPTEIGCSMDAELRALHLKASDGSEREVEIAQVKAVYVGKDAEKLGFQGLAVEPLCTTLELKSDDCLTFKFPDLQQRDRFALCMRIFASAKQAEA